MKQWNKGENVNTCLKYFTLYHAEQISINTCNVEFYVFALAKVAGYISVIQMSENVEDDTLPEGGGGR